MDDTSPCLLPTYISGDVGGDWILGLSETWIYECTAPTPTEEVTNIATVEGYDAAYGTRVEDDATETVEINPPPIVTVIPAEATICAAQDVELCAEVEEFTGTPPFAYSWTKDGGAEFATTDCVTVSEAGVYRVTVTDAAGCDDFADSTLAVIPTPDCSIDSGPTSICEEDIGIPVEYCTLVVADGYYWEVLSGPADPILLVDNGLPCVDVVPTGLGTIVLKLSTVNDVPDDEEDCWNGCEIEILVEECGGAFCTFTQGYYGNKGGRKCGLKTPALIDALLAYGDVVVGVPGHSITLGTSKCIIDLLPAGGTAAVLPAGNFGCGETGDPLPDIPDSILKDFSKKESRFNNVLIGQIVALTLNLRLFDIDCIGEDGTGDLAGWELPEEFCTIGPDGCPKKHTTPDGFVGLEVGAILALANDVIGGEDVGLSPSEINGAVSFINEAFDGCSEIVSCPTEEICCNGCDDDFNGLTDGEDPACAEICDNGIDDDCDELIDTEDPDCQPS